MPALGKFHSSPAEALGEVVDGSTVLIGGWGGVGVPTSLIQALVQRRPRALVVVSNNCGMGVPGDIGELFGIGAVAKAIASFPSNPKAVQFRERYESGEVALELSPQGTLAERIRAGGAGLGGFFTPTGAGTLIAHGKDARVINGVEQIFEEAITADLAVIRAHEADRLGNLRFRFAARSFNPLMAMAARRTVVEVDRVVAAGAIGPDDVHLPGIFVDAVTLSGEAGR